MGVWILILLSLPSRKALHVSLRPGGSLPRSTSGRVPGIERPLKIPVWPVWGGVAAQLAEWMGMRRLAASVLDGVGGRVVPTSFGAELSPFLLLAHHTHSFTPFDPTRQIVNLVQPEGFPAHPHAGFHTVTITLEGSGGLRHRDSAGESSRYANGDTQFMRAGSGILHEEMWDIDDSRHTGIEIYQLWVNSPQKDKSKDSRTTLVKGSDIVERTLGDGGAGSVKLLCGHLDLGHEQIEGPGTGLLDSAVCLMLMEIEEGKSVDLLAELDSPINAAATMAVYIRRGSLIVKDSSEGSTEAFAGEIVTFGSSSSTLQAGNSCGSFSGLVMIGQPLGEEVIQRGPLVAASTSDLIRAAQPFQLLGSDIYWDHRISDDEWRKHVQSIKLQEILRRHHQK